MEKLGECNADIEDMIKRVISGCFPQVLKNEIQKLQNWLCVVKSFTYRTCYRHRTHHETGNFSSTRQLVKKSGFRVTHNGQSWFCIPTGLSLAKYTTDIEIIIKQVF